MVYELDWPVALLALRFHSPVLDVVTDHLNKASPKTAAKD